MTMARRVHHTVPAIDLSEIGPGVAKVIDLIKGSQEPTKAAEHDLHFLYDGTDPHPTAIKCLGCDWEAAVG